MGKKEIDWSNPKSNISEYFTVHEATFLPSWGIYHTPNEKEKKEIVKLAEIMDKIRKKLGKPIIVHVWMRPKQVNCPTSDKHGQDYNLFIGSKSTKSGHIFGQAVDFHVKDHEGAEKSSNIRRKILPLLEDLQIRMEDIDGNWIHIDTKEVIYNRFFKP
jgi:uncharacterized ubiquitin-like protein YukD